MNEEIKRKREGIKRGVYILPSLCTSVNLFCGFFSVIQSLKGNFVGAAWAILFAGFFDFLDGRIARTMHAKSDFGVEYDSLCDLASFGFAPAVLAYTWALNAFQKLGWLVAFLFFACGALRLARFNVQSDNEESYDFQGLPIPSAAYVLAALVIFYDSKYGVPPFGSYVILITTFILALLMVSTIRYRSFKQVDFMSKKSFFVLVGIVVGIFVVAIHPKVTLLIVTSSYVSLGIIEELITLRKSKEYLQKRRVRKEEKKQQGYLAVVGGEEFHQEKNDVDE